MENSKKKRSEAKESQLGTLKRKRVVLNFAQRASVCEKLRQGLSLDKIASEYNVGISTIRDIGKKVSQCWTRYQAENCSAKIEKKILTQSAYPKVDAALKIWYYQQRAKNHKSQFIQLNLQNKAKEFYQLFYSDHEATVNKRKPFQASQGYVSRFFRRHGIELTKNYETPELGIQHFSKKLTNLINEESYSMDQIYTADEFGLNPLSMPNEINLGKNEHVTVMACSNASASHKLPLMFIHNEKNPSCFLINDGVESRLIDKSSLPVSYYFSQNGSATQENFIDWFHSHFVPAVRVYLVSIDQPPKAVLLLDCGTPHPCSLTSNDGKIKCVSIPGDICPLVNPMEGGITLSLRRRYKLNLVKNMLQTSVQHITPSEFFKTYTVKDVIYSLSKIWHEFDLEFIRSSWHRLRLNLTEPSVIESVNIEDLISNLARLGVFATDFQCIEWLSEDSNHPGYTILSDYEIIKIVERNEENILDEIDLSDLEGMMIVDSGSQTRFDVTRRPIISANQALQYSSELLRWLEAQKSSKSEDILLMHKIKESAASKFYESLNGPSGCHGTFLATIPNPNSVTAQAKSSSESRKKRSSNMSIPIVKLNI